MPEIYDESLSLKLANGNADLARQMLGMLLKELPLLKESANNAFTSGDQDAFYAHVHKINGSTRYSGVPALTQAAHKLETLIKNKAEGQDEALGTMNQEVEKLLKLNLTA